MKYTEEIRRIKLSLTIENVVGDYLNLKKKGQNYWACCPFHHEKSPSFAVNPSKGIYHCFGCKETGDIFSFVQKHEGLTFPEALEKLAKKANVELPKQEIEKTDTQLAKEEILIANKVAKEYFESCIQNNASAIEYIVSRSYSQVDIKRFSFGYAPESWNGLIQYAKSKGVSEATLTKAKLVSENKEKGSVYDFFRNRVMIPLFDEFNDVVGFTGRVLDKEQKPKYLNTPETLVFNKSKLLYGLNAAKAAIRKQGFAYVVEGNLDVCTLHKNGFENTVCASGTAFTEEHIKTLKRHTQEVIVVFDNDIAGMKASLRVLDMLLTHGFKVYYVVLPQGKDPDDFVRSHGRESFLEYVSSKKISFVKFKATVLYKDFKDANRISDICKDVVKSIALLDDDVSKELYLRELSEFFNISFESIMSLAGKTVVRAKKEKENVPIHSKVKYEQMLFNICLRNRVEDFPMESVIDYVIEGFSDDVMGFFRVDVFKTMKQAYIPSYDTFIQELINNEVTKEFAINFLADDIEKNIVVSDLQELKTYLCNAVYFVKTDAISKMIKNILASEDSFEEKINKVSYLKEVKKLLDDFKKQNQEPHEKNTIRDNQQIKEPTTEVSNGEVSRSRYFGELSGIGYSHSTYGDGSGLDGALSFNS